MPALLLLLAGCSQSALLQKFASPEDQALAKNCFELLQQHRFDELEKAMDPSLQGPELHNALVKMASVVPTEEPTSITLIGAHRRISTESSGGDVTFEYGFSGKWLLVGAAMKQQGGRTTIVGFHVTPQSAAYEEQNKFTLAGKSPVQHAVLALVVILPLFTLYTLVVCIRTKFAGRKWPWILFILFGVGKFAVNWTTGECDLSQAYIQLFSASAAAMPPGPWILSISFPLGAVLFLIRRKKLMAPAAKTSSVLADDTATQDATIELTEVVR